MSRKLHEYLEKEVKKPIKDMFDYAMSIRMDPAQYGTRDKKLQKEFIDYMFKKSAQIVNILSTVIEKVKKVEEGLTGEHGKLANDLHLICNTFLFLNSYFEGILKDIHNERLWFSSSNPITEVINQIGHNKVEKRIKEAIKLAKKIEVEL